MDENRMVKKVFPGGNTTRGFYSFFEYIIGPDANRLFILKGGPGVGKSTFMKKIGKEMLDKGYRIEEHYCSSSNNSLDGVVIPELKVALIDGTAPHMIDPKTPGAVDEIINLGDYWKSETLENNKFEIIKVQKEVGKCFAKAYRYLKSIDPFLNNLSLVYQEARDDKKYYKLQEDVLNEIFRDAFTMDRIGEERHLFGSGITPRGVVDYLETIVGIMDRIYYIKGEWGTGWSNIIYQIANKAIVYGYDVELYHTPFNPDLVESLVISELKIAITNNNKFMNNNSKKFDLKETMDIDIINKYREDLDFDSRMYQELLSQSIYHINKAKEAHDTLEGFYIPSMDFNSIQRRREEVINRILEYGN